MVSFPSHLLPRSIRAHRALLEKLSPLEPLIALRHSNDLLNTAQLMNNSLTAPPLFEVYEITDTVKTKLLHC